MKKATNGWLETTSTNADGLIASLTPTAMVLKMEMEAALATMLILGMLRRNSAKSTAKA